MPFTSAHHWLLPLFPLILLAFWPGYFGRLGGAPFALHVHGLSATLWIGLVTLQGWTIGRRRIAQHRFAGRLVLLAVPLFAAGALLAMQGMAALAATRADPFHATYGARLALGYANRTSFVIAPDGHVLYSYTDLNPDKHVENTMAAVQKWVDGHGKKS